MASQMNRMFEDTESKKAMILGRFNVQENDGCHVTWCVSALVTLVKNRLQLPTDLGTWRR